MNIPHMFFICLTVAVIGFIIAIVNVATGVKRTLASGNPTNMLLVHALAAIVYVLGGLGTIGFGIAWIVTYLKH
jgi:hypothetical protein